MAYIQNYEIRNKIAFCTNILILILIILGFSFFLFFKKLNCKKAEDFSNYKLKPEANRLKAAVSKVLAFGHPPMIYFCSIIK